MDFARGTSCRFLSPLSAIECLANGIMQGNWRRDLGFHYGFSLGRDMMGNHDVSDTMAFIPGKKWRELECIDFIAPLLTI